MTLEVELSRQRGQRKLVGVGFGGIVVAETLKQDEQPCDESGQPVVFAHDRVFLRVSLRRSRTRAPNLTTRLPSAGTTPTVLLVTAPWPSTCASPLPIGTASTGMASTFSVLALWTAPG
jgi:hypothetical protein